VDPRRCRGPDRRHGHRRQRPPPSREAEGSPLMSETTFTLDSSDIASALRKRLDGFKPDMSESEVGRVIEVGDGIARVSGLPRASVNELLEFEGGVLGIA